MSSNVVTPFNVEIVADYDRLVRDFGCEPMTNEIISRFESLTKVKMPVGYRNFVISHREFDKILDAFDKKEPLYLYTGRGPSSERMHLGHLVPFQFCKFLQDAFGVPVVIQITDDEKYIFKGIPLDQVHKMARENIKDIIACGFDPDRTFIFENTNFVKELYPMVLQIQKAVTLAQIMSTFGFPTESTCIGKVAFPPMQAAPAFAQTFKTVFKGPNAANLRKVRCLIPCAIDQDPYFRMSRGIAGKLKHPKPAVIHTKFLPGLAGTQTKMSASTPKECIYLGESIKKIKKKINCAFSGGQEFLDDHRRLGGDPEKDVAYQLLTFFCNDNTHVLGLAEGFRKGTVGCGDMKNAATKAVEEVISEFRKRRSEITVDTLQRFMTNKIAL